MTKKATPENPIAKPAKAAKRPKLTDAEQSAAFERVAREHDAEGSEAEFNETLRRLAKPKLA